MWILLERWKYDAWLHDLYSSENHDHDWFISWSISNHASADGERTQLLPWFCFQLDDAIKGPFFVRRAGLLWSQQDFWVVVICPIIKCLTVLEFSFILFDLCLFITIFNFILNYVPIITFWIFTYHKIWILLIIFCFIWNYWIIYFLTCLEVFWNVVS